MNKHTGQLKIQKELPSIKDIFDNAHFVSDDIHEQIENKTLTSKEAKELIDDLKEVIDLMESLKKSLKE